MLSFLFYYLSLYNSFCRIPHHRGPCLHFSNNKTQSTDMCTCFNSDIVANNSRRMDIHLVLYNNPPHTGHMRINAVPVANLCIMPYHRISLNHIIITDFCIIANHRICSDKVSFA